MSSTLKLNCEFCNGEMVRPFPIHSYDFNKEGYVAPFCSECGICKDVEDIIIAVNGNKGLSNKFIKKILKILCNRQIHFSYEILDKIYREAKDKKFYNAFDFAEYLMNEFQYYNVKIDSNFIFYSIYCNHLGNYSMFSFT